MPKQQHKDYPRPPRQPELLGLTGETPQDPRCPEAMSFNQDNHHTGTQRHQAVSHDSWMPVPANIPHFLPTQATELQFQDNYYTSTRQHEAHDGRMPYPASIPHALPQDPHSLEATDPDSEYRDPYHAMGQPRHEAASHSGWIPPPTGSLVPDPTRAYLGLEIAQRAWMAMPRRPQIQVLGQPEPESMVISTGEADPVHRPVRETHVWLPPTPHILTVALPTAPARTSTAEGTAISTPMHSTSTTEPSVAALPVPQAMVHPPPPSQPAASIPKGSKRKIVEAAKRSIYTLLLTKAAVPTSEGKSRFIDIATEDGFRSVCGGAVVQKWDMEIELTTAMASVRQSFRDYALCRVQQAFGLRLPLDMDEIEHKRSSVKYLLADLRYLKKSIQINTGDTHIDTEELFTTEFFTDLVINVLFLGNQQLHQFITHDNLDQVFALAGAAICASLREFREGYYKERSVAADNWRDDYHDVMEVLESMRSNEEQRDWLTGWQRQMLMKGRSLRRASDS